MDQSPPLHMLLDALGGLGADFWQLGRKHSWQPAPQSIAAEDAAEPSLVIADWDGVPHLGQLVAGAAISLAVSANDHLHGVVRLLSPPQRLWAAHTSTRGLLEASARAWFMTDPNVNPGERSRRCANDVLYSLHEMTLLRRHAGANEAFTQNELDEVVASVRRFGWLVTQRRPKMPPYVEVERPSSTSLISDMLQLPTGLAFRQTSAVAHANLTAIQRVPGTTTEIMAALKTEDGHIDLSPEHVHTEYGHAAVGYANMALRMAYYLGWSNQVWRSSLMRQVGVWGYT